MIVQALSSFPVAVSLENGWQAFDGIWEKVRKLAKGSTCKAYLDGCTFSGESMAVSTMNDFRSLLRDEPQWLR